MLFLLAFWTFVASTLVIGWRAAKPYDKRLIAAIIVAILATLTLDTTFGVVRATPWVWLVDLGLLIFLVHHSLRTQAYWPLWFAALHGIAVITSISGIAFVNSNLSYFQTLAGFWAIPSLLIMATGCFWDRYSITKDETDVENQP